MTELLIILGVAALLFGGRRMADIGKGLGEGIRNFKRGMSDDSEPPQPRLPGNELRREIPPDGSAKP